MIINFTQIANTLALVGCAGLLILWVLASRKILGFLYVCMGWSLLIAAIRCDGNLPTLERWFLLLIPCWLLVLILYGLLQARRKRIPVYVPVDQRKRG